MPLFFLALETTRLTDAIGNADAWWFMLYEGGPQISWYQLVSFAAPSICRRIWLSLTPGGFAQTHFHSCSEKFSFIGCDMFTNEMAKRATTVSLSILVVIEMFNVSEAPAPSRLTKD